MTTTASPIRNPDTSSRSAMTTRAWWLVVLNILVPGAPQLLAGTRTLGKIGLASTLFLWSSVGVLLAAGSLWPNTIYSLLTAPFALTLIQAILLAYAALWLILTLDTLRLVRLIRTFPRARLWLAGMSVVLMSVSSGTAAYASYMVGVQRSAIEEIFTTTSVAVPPIDGRYNILLLGGDAGPDRDGMRPDSISVISIDAETGQAVTIGVPRDLRHVPFVDGSPLVNDFPSGVYDCGSECQISYLYSRILAYDSDMYPDAEAHGSNAGIEATKDAVEGALGITIQYYVLIDMQGFSDLIDALGGVTIEVSERQPIGGDENLNEVEGWIEPGVQRMDGYTALWYARSRHASSDYDRMERQRQLQEAILAQFDPGNVLSKFESIADAGAQVVSTDIPQSMLGYFVQLALKTKNLPMERVELVPPVIDPEDPDFAVVHGLVDAALSPPTIPTPAP